MARIAVDPPNFASTKEDYVIIAAPRVVDPGVTLSFNRGHRGISSAGYYEWETRPDGKQPYTAIQHLSHS
jgi:hypothetical protein